MVWGLGAFDRSALAIAVLGAAAGGSVLRRVRGFGILTVAGGGSHRPAPLRADGSRLEIGRADAAGSGGMGKSGRFAAWGMRAPWPGRS